MNVYQRLGINYHMNETHQHKRRLPSLLRWILWALIVQFILFNISSAIYAHRLTHFYKQVETENPADRNIFEKTWKLFTGPRQSRSASDAEPVFSFENIQFKTAKGLSIAGWYGPADTLARGTVIFLHGITGNKSFLIDEAHECRSWGYNVLLLDLRGHGASEGSLTSIGVRETEELKLAWDYIQAKGEKNIYLYGVSMGAVVVARAVADWKLEPAGVVLDMPFASLQSYLANKARTLGFPSQPFAFFTTFWIGIQRGYNGYRHQTTRYVKKLDCPVLMQWGARDGFVLRDETERIYEAIPGGNKKLVIYNEARHESFLNKDPVKWRIEMEGFLGR
ncbi:MAG TPA: alpha/beta fold hydrolase [Chitinophagaceae bacterium]|nr:alpha/beta fold hydrolase [Chitinophagaceae bacterium]